jgi:hypothetical protein
MPLDDGTTRGHAPGPVLARENDVANLSPAIGVRKNLSFDYRLRKSLHRKNIQSSGMILAESWQERLQRLDDQRSFGGIDLGSRLLIRDRCSRKRHLVNGL